MSENSVNNRCYEVQWPIRQLENESQRYCIVQEQEKGHSEQKRKTRNRRESGTVHGPLSASTGLLILFVCLPLPPLRKKMAASPSAVDEGQDNWGPSDDAAMGPRRSAEPSNDPLPVDDRGQDPNDPVDYPRSSSVGSVSVHKGENFREKQVKVLIRSCLSLLCLLV